MNALLPVAGLKLKGDQNVAQHGDIRKIGRVSARCALLAISMLWMPRIYAIDLDQTVVNKIYQAVYEVVVKKPDHDPLVYERALPWHLLPFQFRTDPYFSVGTAFCGEDGFMITAAHVLNIGRESLHKQYAVRDKNGAVYPVDKLYKYSRDRDFAVFSVEGLNACQGLLFAPKHAANDRVFIVGNAMGEGIVIRQGFHASDTPEEQDGAWKWIRYSVPTSQGYSGGPLLDHEGRVIGVVVRKSRGDGLNYALPVKEIVKFPGRAEMKSHAEYKLEFMDEVHEFSIDLNYVLPQPMRDIDARMQRDLREIVQQSADEFSKKFHSRIFPHDNASLPILYNRYTALFPGIIARTAGGGWNISQPAEIRKVDLESGGALSWGRMWNYYFLKLTRPRGDDVGRFYIDAKGFMDHVLKGIRYTRQVGESSVRVTSMGDAVESHLYTDRYGRRWQVRLWDDPFADQRVAVYALPTPDGYVAMLSVGDAADVAMNSFDLRAFTDNFYFTYFGTLRDWQRFLAMKEILPAFANSIDMTLDSSGVLRYNDTHFSFRLEPDVVTLDEDSAMELRCTYFKQHNHVVWAPGAILVGEKPETKRYAMFGRTQKPPPELSYQYRRNWESVAALLPPGREGLVSYDGFGSHIKQITYPENLVSGDSPILYELSWHETGRLSQGDLQRKLDSIAANFKGLR